VVVLTSSQAEQDIVASYDLNANCYISKPVDLAQFIKVVKSIEDLADRGETAGGVVTWAEPPKRVLLRRRQTPATPC